MKYIHRFLEERIHHTFERGKSVLLLGARQTGKTTLINRFKHDLLISFVPPDISQQYEKSPHLLKGEVEALAATEASGLARLSAKPRAAMQAGKRPLVILDEVQKVPGILDVVQDLIDRGKANFILTGSSARKLRRGAQVNLLPGRVVAFRMDPFSLQEFPAKDLNERLIYGSLPGILSVQPLADREADLESYVTTYLEEEVRSEAVVRNLGDFARF